MSAPTQERIDQARRRAAETELRTQQRKQDRPWAGSLGDRINRLLKAHNDTVKVYGDNFDHVIAQLEQLRRDIVLLRDDIEAAKHWHDRRIDEIWGLLIGAGILPTEAYHMTVRDNSDAWGRVLGCDHCAPFFKDFPWEGSVLERLEAERARAHEANRDVWDDDDE